MYELLIICAVGIVIFLQDNYIPVKMQDEKEEEKKGL